MRAGLTRRMVVASGLLALIVGGAFGALLLAIDDLRESADLARHSREELIVADELEKLVVDLETGLRGYVITREERFLEPWAAARSDLPERARALARLAANDPVQLGRVRRIERAGLSYIRDYALPLIAAVRRDDPSARSVARTEEGKRRVDALRAQFDEFVATERALLTARQDAADADAERAIVASLAGLAGSLVLVLAFTGYLTRAIVQPVRRAAAMAGRLAGGDLATRMPETGVAEIGVLERAFNVMGGSLERSRDELARLAEEQAALRRVATLVARGAAPADVFSAVAEEVGQLLGGDITKVLRYEPDGTATVVGGWSVPGMHIPLGTRLTVEGEGLAALVLRTGRPARTETFDGPPGSVADCFRRTGVRSGAASPIVVQGRRWGVVIVAAAQPERFPAEAEARLADFAELVGTAIANAESRAELTASRARIVAAADDTRRRIERDLHDGAQQRLVSLALALRTIPASVPPGHPDLEAQLSDVTEGLNAIVAELQEISRGIHPAILSEGGLGPALKTLARRSAVPVELNVDAIGRLPERVEVAAYYVVSEALTNAAKHAAASVAHVDVQARNGALELSIRDDGAGGADPARGSGLIGLTDRVEALGGTLEVASPVGEGTSLRVTLPIDGG